MTTRLGFLQEDPMPQLIDPLKTLPIADDAKNRRMARDMLARKHQVLEDTPGFTFLRIGDDYNGYFIQYIKSLDLIGHYVHYKASRMKLIGGDLAVTQIMLWRRTGTPFVPGRTKHVFFDYLLKIWPAVMSDGQQTPRGAEFWANMLAEASVHPDQFDVGFLVRNTGRMDWWDGVAFDMWLDARDGWGREERYRDRRFVIKRK